MHILVFFQISHNEHKIGRYNVLLRCENSWLNCNDSHSWLYRKESLVAFMQSSNNIMDKDNETGWKINESRERLLRMELNSSYGWITGRGKQTESFFTKKLINSCLSTYRKKVPKRLPITRILGGFSSSNFSQTAVLSFVLLDISSGGKTMASYSRAAFAPKSLEQWIWMNGVCILVPFTRSSFLHNPENLKLINLGLNKYAFIFSSLLRIKRSITTLSLSVPVLLIKCQ